VYPGPEDDVEVLAELTNRLRGELLDLDVEAVELIPDAIVPHGSKGLATAVGWLAAQLGPEALRAVLVKVTNWATRNGREVEVSYGGDTLKLGWATREQQQEVIDAWLARHAAGS